MRLKVLMAIKKRLKNRLVHHYSMMRSKIAKHRLRRRLKNCVNKAVSVEIHWFTIYSVYRMGNFENILSHFQMVSIHQPKIIYLVLVWSKNHFLTTNVIPKMDMSTMATTIHSMKRTTLFIVNIYRFVCLTVECLHKFIVSGDYDGSDNEYDDDNNEYDNSESKDYGCAHWERKNHPDLSNVKEEKVWLSNGYLFFNQLIGFN